MYTLVITSPPKSGNSSVARKVYELLAKNIEHVHLIDDYKDDMVKWEHNTPLEGIRIFDRSPWDMALKTSSKSKKVRKLCKALKIPRKSRGVEIDGVWSEEIIANTIDEIIRNDLSNFEKKRVIYLHVQLDNIKIRSDLSPEDLALYTKYTQIRRDFYVYRYNFYRLNTPSFDFSTGEALETRKRKTRSHTNDSTCAVLGTKPNSL
jgi:hypothetical protein